MSNKISVITVVYNDVANIRATMESFFSQTWEDKEYIVIDGGSTDGTADIIKEYAPRLAYWCSEKDNGIYDAMNKGIIHATGDWINILNCGDVYANNNVFSKIFSESDYQGISVVYGNSIEIKSGREYYTPAKEDYHKLSQMVVYRHGSSFIRSSVQKNDLYNLELKKKLGYALDFEMIHRIYKKGHLFKKININIEKFQSEGISAKPFRSIWYNYLIISGCKFKISTLPYLVKKMGFRLLSTSPFYKFAKALGIEFMVNDILPHIPFWRIRKAYLRLVGMHIGQDTYITKKNYIMSPWLINIGKYGHINRDCTLDGRGIIEIGNSVSISHGVKLMTGSHDIQNCYFPGIYEKITIEDYAWLGVNCIILKGITIGKGAVVAAGAVVTKNVPDYTIVAGIPAKPIGKRKENLAYKCIWKELFT